MHQKQYIPSKVFLGMHQHFLMNGGKKKTAARKQFAEKPFLINIYAQGSSSLKILMTFLAEGGRKHGNVKWRYQEI